MTGSRQVGHLVRELRRRNLRYGVVTMCVGGGMGASGLFGSRTLSPCATAGPAGRGSASWVLFT